MSSDISLIKRARIAAEKNDERLYAEIANRLESLIDEVKELRSRINASKIVSDQAKGSTGSR